MGKGRIWTSLEKAKIVVQGLKGRVVSEICNEYRIRQTQYYKWRGQFLENIPKIFETKSQSQKEMIKCSPNLLRVDLTGKIISYVGKRQRHYQQSPRFF